MMYIKISIEVDMLFCKIEGLADLENQKKWKEILEKLNSDWQKDINNPEILLRLASECWFILSNSDNLNISDEIYNFAKTLLKESFQYHYQNISNNKNDLIFGYMVSLDPGYFCEDSSSDDEYIYYEQLGKKLIEKAYNENPMDNLNATLYFGTDNKFLKKYKKVRKELQLSIDSLFSSETEIERYFLDVLRDNARVYKK